MPKFRHFDNPTWEEVLKDEATVDDYIMTVAHTIWDSWGTIPRGPEANELIRKQYFIDKKRMEEEGIAPEDIPDPFFKG